MSDYKVAIKIAGELSGSFNSALKGAQSGLNTLAKIGKVGATALGASAAAMGTLAAAGSTPESSTNRPLQALERPWTLRRRNSRL